MDENGGEWRGERGIAETVVVWQYDNRTAAVLYGVSKCVDGISSGLHEDAVVRTGMYAAACSSRLLKNSRRVQGRCQACQARAPKTKAKAKGKAKALFPISISFSTAKTCRMTPLCRVTLGRGFS